MLEVTSYRPAVNLAAEASGISGRFRLSPVMVALLAMYMLPTPARAQACGPVPPGTAPELTCTHSPDDHKDGISYLGTVLPDGLHLTLSPEVVVRRSPGFGNHGVDLATDGFAPIQLDVARGVAISTEGENVVGLKLSGKGDLTINSHADITVNDPDPASSVGGPYNKPFGMVAEHLGAGASGAVVINHLSGALNVWGIESTGIQITRDGDGLALVNTYGEINVSGEQPWGVGVWGSTQGTIENTVDARIVQGTTGRISVTGAGSIGMRVRNDTAGIAEIEIGGLVEAFGSEAIGAFASVTNSSSSQHVRIDAAGTARIQVSGDEANGLWVSTQGSGDAVVESAADLSVIGRAATGLKAEGDNTNGRIEALLHAGGLVNVSGESVRGIAVSNAGTGRASAGVARDAQVNAMGLSAIGVEVSGATSGAEVLATIEGGVTAGDQFGVGLSALSSGNTTALTIGTEGQISGGWQADVNGTSTSHSFGAVGVAIRSNVAARLDNSGRIGAGSDRAVVDAGRYAAGVGNLSLTNRGVVTGFIELASGGQNTVANEAGGLFDLRHFADTDGDGTRDTKRVAISDFGDAASSRFHNMTGATIRLGTVLGNSATDAAGYYVPTGGAPGNVHDLGRDGIVQAQLANLGVFSNAGIIDLRGPEIGNTLVITGNASAGGTPGSGVYSSDGGYLFLNTLFNKGVAAGGISSSYSDVLVVDGTRLGSAPTTIVIDRREGTGAPTAVAEDILLVEVRDDSASPGNVFTLQGDYVVDGEQRLLGGMYSYALNHHAADGNWYLRNVALAPSVPLYQEYPKVLMPLLDLPMRHQGGGNRHWRDPAAPASIPTVFCKNANQDYHCAISQEQASYYLEEGDDVALDTTGVWVRLEGSRGHYEAASSTVDAEYDTDIMRLEIGIDGLLAEGDDGHLAAGVYLHYGDISAEISSTSGSGDIDVKGYGVGGNLTWYGLNGFYLDGQARATWFSSDISSSTLGTQLVDGNDGFGYALGVEMGRKFALNEHWSLIPQAQLIYSRIDFDDFTDPYGAQVAIEQGESLRARLGLAVDRESRWQADDDTTSRASLYGIINLYNEFKDGVDVSISGGQVTSRNDKLWGGIGLGGTYSWNDGKYSMWAEVSANTGLKDFGDSHLVIGTLGLRIRL